MPTAILSINPNICTSLTGATWNHDSNKDTVINTADASYACNRLNDPAMLADLASALGGDVDDPAIYADLSDAGHDQLNENTGKLWVLVFVSNDEGVTLEADEGVWLSSGNSNTNCVAIADEDCDGDGVRGDGVIVDLLLGNGVADLGPAEVLATQSGVDVILDYTVVGDSVGGIAEYPQLEPPAVVTEGNAGSHRTLAAFAMAAGVIVLAAGTWYARRRWLS